MTKLHATLMLSTLCLALSGCAQHTGGSGPSVVANTPNQGVAGADSTLDFLNESATPLRVFANGVELGEVGAFESRGFIAGAGALALAVDRSDDFFTIRQPFRLVSLVTTQRTLVVFEGFDRSPTLFASEGLIELDNETGNTLSVFVDGLPIGDLLPFSSCRIVADAGSYQLGLDIEGDFLPQPFPFRWVDVQAGATTTASFQP